MSKKNDCSLPLFLFFTLTYLFIGQFVAFYVWLPESVANTTYGSQCNPYATAAWGVPHWCSGTLNTADMIYWIDLGLFAPVIEGFAKLGWLLGLAWNYKWGCVAGVKC